MEAATKLEFVTVDEYLSGEESSETKHEFIGGVVYAMAGASKDHNLIAFNVASSLRNHLKGGPCKVFISDVKLRIEISDEDLFYYPDVMVGCDPRDTHRHFLQHPKILVEVLSDGTERVDRYEKRVNYTKLESLEAYLMLAQDRIEVTLFRRANNWQPEVFIHREQSVNLASIGLQLPVAAIYEGIRG